MSCAAAEQSQSLSGQSFGGHLEALASQYVNYYRP